MDLDLQPYVAYVVGGVPKTFGDLRPNNPDFPGYESLHDDEIPVLRVQHSTGTKCHTMSFDSARYLLLDLLYQNNALNDLEVPPHAVSREFRRLRFRLKHPFAPRVLAEDTLVDEEGMDVIETMPTTPFWDSLQAYPNLLATLQNIIPLMAQRSVEVIEQSLVDAFSAGQLCTIEAEKPLTMSQEHKLAMAHFNQQDIDYQHEVVKSIFVEPKAYTRSQIAVELAKYYQQLIAEKEITYIADKLFEEVVVDNNGEHVGKIGFDLATLYCTRRNYHTRCMNVHTEDLIREYMANENSKNPDSPINREGITGKQLEDFYYSRNIGWHRQKYLAALNELEAGESNQENINMLLTDYNYIIQMMQVYGLTVKADSQLGDILKSNEVQLLGDDLKTVYYRFTKNFKDFLKDPKFIPSRANFGWCNSFMSELASEQNTLSPRVNSLRTYISEYEYIATWSRALELKPKKNTLFDSFFIDLVKEANNWDNQETDDGTQTRRERLMTKIFSVSLEKYLFKQLNPADYGKWNIAANFLNLVGMDIDSAQIALPNLDIAKYIGYWRGVEVSNNGELYVPNARADLIIYKWDRQKRYISDLITHYTRIKERFNIANLSRNELLAVQSIAQLLTDGQIKMELYDYKFHINKGWQAANRPKMQQILHTLDTNTLLLRSIDPKLRSPHQQNPNSSGFRKKLLRNIGINFIHVAYPFLAKNFGVKASEFTMPGSKKKHKLIEDLAYPLYVTRDELTMQVQRIVKNQYMHLSEEMVNEIGRLVRKDYIMRLWEENGEEDDES